MAPGGAHFPRPFRSSSRGVRENPKDGGEEKQGRTEQTQQQWEGEGEREMTLLQYQISIQAGIKTGNKVTPLSTGVSKQTNLQMLK